MIEFMRGARAALRTVFCDARAGKGLVEAGWVVDVAAAYQELDPVSALFEVHQHVARLLGNPRGARMRGGAENVDAPGGVLDHRQDVGLGAFE